jgi:hypothetical protein
VLQKRCAQRLVWPERVALSFAGPSELLRITDKVLFIRMLRLDEGVLMSPRVNGREFHSRGTHSRGSVHTQ